MLFNEQPTHHAPRDVFEYWLRASSSSPIASGRRLADRRPPGRWARLSMSYCLCGTKV
jgi:hypothetical protein